MGDQVTFPINYNTSKIDQACNSSAKEFGRSFAQNMANIFGVGHAASYATGKSDLQIEMENMQKDMDKLKWKITVNLIKGNQQLEEADLTLMNEILVNLQEQSSYYSSIFDPQFEDITILDRFRMSLLFTIIFMLIAFINWK